MVYDIQLFCRSAHAVSIVDLQSALQDCRFEVTEADGAAWTQLLVSSLDGHEICIIEHAGQREVVNEVALLRRDLVDYRPRSASRWVEGYLDTARHLFGCHYLSFGLSKAFAATPPAVMWAIQTLAGGGIVHAEGQGFSNEEGYQITWEFSGRVSGARQMAILSQGDRWHPFEMDLGDEAQRSAFLAGERPVGAELLDFN